MTTSPTLLPRRRALVWAATALAAVLLAAPARAGSHVVVWPAQPAPADASSAVEAPVAAPIPSSTSRCGCGGPKAERVRLYGSVAPPPED